MNTSWQTHAQRRGDTYHYFGPPGWADQHDGDGVVAVELVENEDGPYYGWLDAGDFDHGPVCVNLGYRAMLRAFQGTETTEDPVREQQAGKGRIVRLQVRELRPVKVAR